MKTYIVGIKRNIKTIQYANIEIKAENEDQAEKIAAEKAKEINNWEGIDFEWVEDGAYEIEIEEEIED